MLMSPSERQAFYSKCESAVWEDGSTTDSESKIQVERFKVSRDWVEAYESRQYWHAILCFLVDFPLMCLRLLLLRMGLEVTYPFLIKNIVSVITELAICYTGQSDNPVSAKISSMLALIPGADKLDREERKAELENQ